MTSRKPIREPSIRVSFLLGLGGVLVLILCTVVALSPRRPAAGPGTDAEAAAASAAPESDQPVPIANKARAKPGVARADNSPLSDLQLSFKLDPRLTRGLYMGDRWVSPPTYTRVGEGRACLVEVQVKGVDAQGKPVEISPAWSAGDAGVVTVSSAGGKAVCLAVQGAGESSLEVSALGFTKTLALHATEQDGVLVVAIDQPAVQELNVVKAGPSQAEVGPQAARTIAAAQPARPRHQRPVRLASIPEPLAVMAADLQAFREQLDGSVPDEAEGSEAPNSQ